MKAQVGIEYLVMVALSLAIAGVIWVYASADIERTQWNLEVAYAKDAVNKITEVADMVHVQGAPAQSYIHPTFPASIENIYISENKVTMELLWKGNNLRNITSTASVNLTGTLPATQGSHRILIRDNVTFVELIDM